MNRVTLDLQFLPDYPIDLTVEIAKKAESYGFRSICFADEIYYKDPWTTSACVARETSTIGIGLGALGVYMRPPPVLAQALATLDEISHGRVYSIVSTGNPYMLEQIGIKIQNPVGAIRDAVRIMRLMWSGEPVTYEGKRFSTRGAYTTARPTERPIPIYIAVQGGPRLFVLGGEIADGVVTGTGASREYFNYALENIRLGAHKANRNLADIELVGAVPCACAQDSEQAREIIRPLITFYLPSMSPIALSVERIDTTKVAGVSQLLFKGDFPSAIKATGDDIVDKLSLHGSPDEIVEKIERNFIPTGFKRIMLMIPDSTTYAKMGINVEAPSYTQTLQLIKERVIPHL